MSRPRRPLKLRNIEQSLRVALTERRIREHYAVLCIQSHLRRWIVRVRDYVLV